MSSIAKRTRKANDADTERPGDGPPEEGEDDDDGLELPVSPDEGAPLIPDDDRVVMPS